MTDHLIQLKQQFHKRGSPLWYARALLARLHRRRLLLIKDYFDYILLARENARKMRGKSLREGQVTVVITSAGRRDYLQQTIQSLDQNLLFDRSKLKWFIIDDYPDSLETRDFIENLSGFDLKLLNPKNMGLGYSLNKIYIEIDTEFVFHCEDDWLFLRPLDLNTMIRILRENPYLRQLLPFRYLLGPRRHPAKMTDKGFAEKFHKFSLNPHLARTDLYIANQPFPLYQTELEYTLKLERKGWKVSGVFEYGEEPYIAHLGVDKKATKI